MSPFESRISVQEFQAFNDELAALIRAGIPLELGLNELVQSQEVSLGRITRTITERMTNGESLSDALKAEGRHFPAAYRSLVEAGIRSGRLTTVLETVAHQVNLRAGLRRELGMALVYPLIIVLLAYTLFVGVILNLADVIHQTYVAAFFEQTKTIQAMYWLKEHALLWVWVLPAFLLTLFFWWLISGRRVSFYLSRFPVPLRWLPGVRRLDHSVMSAHFAELLALLVEHEVPLDDALILAGESCGDTRLRNSAVELSRLVSSGQAPTEEFMHGFPPFLRWLLSYGMRTGQLKTELKIAARLYQGKAERQLKWVKFSFPLITAVFLGGGVTLIYTLTFMLPVIELLESLAI